MPEDGKNTRKHPRVGFKTRLKIKLPDFPRFIERYSKDISEGGMFIFSKDPKPVGSVVHFTFVEKESEVILEGEGIVRWIRLSDPANPELEPGMGIEFTGLNEGARNLVKRIVANRIEEESKKPGKISDGVPAKKIEKKAEKKAQEKKSSVLEIEKMIEDAKLEDKEELDQIKTKGFFKEEVARPLRNAVLDPKKAPIIGIDLGTTNSCVAFVKDGKPTIIPSKKGYRTIPSIVSFPMAQPAIIGQDARPFMTTLPKRTVYGSKRMLGRKFRSKIVEEIKPRFQYEIIEGGDGDVAVDLEGKSVPLPLISSLILKELKEIAEDYFAQRVVNAVITVPAYYNNRQRECVKEAGKLAGLDVRRIVNEPTAAALAYGLNKGLTEKVLIYDLGGGTFDVSVMDIANNVFEVMASGGDSFLGGLDFDNRITDYLVMKFHEKTGIGLSGNLQALQRVREAAEKAKIDLSLQSQTIVSLPYIAEHAGKPHDLVMEITREEINSITGDLVNKTVRICQEVLRIKGLRRGDINEIILVGGQTRMPLVSETLTNIFGKPPKKGVHPDEVVAMGAALLADSFDKVDSVVLLDALSIPIGVGLPGGRFKPIIPVNTRIPFEKTYVFSTTRDDQTSLDIDIYQGEGDLVENAEYLGTFVLGDIPKAAKGASRITLTFTLDAECILNLKATESLSGKITETQMIIRETPDTIKKQFEKEKSK